MVYFRHIKYLREVKRLLARDGQPATIDDFVVKGIEENIPTYEEKMKRYGVQKGDTIKIRSGIFRNSEAKFQDYDKSGQNCIMLIRILGGDREFKIPKSDAGL